jgi:hypothetical protein
MPDACYFVADGGVNPQFFLQLAVQGIARLFALFDLASGEFPLQRHGLVAGALADQNLLVFEDQRRYHSLHRHRVTFILLQALGTSLRFVAALWDAMVVGESFIGERLIG